MGIDSACILCNFPDTSVHLCRSYSDVQGVWSASGFPWVNLIKGGSFKYWWIEIMERCSLTELSHITCLCYYIWEGRNRMLFEGETFPQHRVYARAFDMVTCFSHTGSSTIE